MRFKFLFDFFCLFCFYLSFSQLKKDKVYLDFFLVKDKDFETPVQTFKRTISHPTKGTGVRQTKDKMIRVVINTDFIYKAQLASLPNSLLVDPWS